MGVLINNEPMLRINRHPILIDHETQVVLDLRPGESLHSFLSRHIENMDGQPMAVTVGGKSVQREMWTNVYPKGGHTIEVRFGVGKTALLIVALIALTIFTMGAAAAVAAGAAATGVGAGFAAGLAAAGLSATASMAVIGAVQIVGAMLINKVLGPKVPKPASIERDSVYNAAGARNSVRQYEPFGLLFGVTRVAPDVISIPYTQYINNDQYMAEVFSPGINVNRFDALYLGDTPLTNYQDVQVWTAGFAGMPQQTIPLFTNVDTIAGGVLEADFAPGPWIERTGSPDSIRLQVDITFLLFDLTSKGKKKVNREQIQIQYKPVGTSTWLSGPQPFISSDSQTETRRTYGWDVAAGQYDIRVRRMGRNTDGSGATAEFSLASIVSIQRDTANYRGIPRIGVQVKATGQLNGALDELRAIMYANPMPMWNGNSWTTATDRSNGLCNPGAQILQYVRGFRDEDGVLIAGMGLPDSQIDIESFKAFMTHCRVNNFTYNQWITDSRTHDEIISAIALAGMGRYTWAPGRITMIWAAEGQPHEGVANMGNIKKGEFQIDYSLSQAADGIEYTYIDGVSFETKTLRVPAPGVTIMTNPARLTGEGVDNETQAALIARYHLAQSIYQFKDVVFSMGIECLSFGQMSMIQLQHDLTQWGYGGRLMSAGRDAQNRVVLKFDEPVPGPQGNGAYVGLRIAGEANYRVFRILAFAGYSDTVTLIDAWPADAAFPGNTEKNPAWDTLYLYDFKQTPGLRCRVTGISPGDDLSGASISVVPESDEFWHYVKTGEYIPPKNESLLRPKPQVSNLRVREERVVQGDTVFSNLNANWRISGYAEYVIVTCAKEGQLPVEVARTSALSATWRVDDPGDYTIVVRPYDGNGMPGEAQIVIQEVLGAVLPPVNPDLLTITELDGGIRKYSWGWLASTIQSPDFAGVEIRYIEGTVSQPDWLAMTPLGNGPDAGYHTTAFESTNPSGGDWTFALRAVNTSGIIATEMLVTQRVLSSNLGEVIDGLDGRIDETYQQALEANNKITQEILDRIAEDLRVANEAVAAARAYTDAQVAALNGILEDIVGADEWTTDAEYPVGDFVRRGGVLYRALVENTGVEPGSDPAVWQEIGEYTSVGDALAAAIRMSTQNATDLQAEAARLDALLVRMPAGNGTLATAASVTEQINVVANQVEAIAQRTNVLEAALPGLATNAYVRQLDEAQTNVSLALGRRIDQTNAMLAGKAEAGTVAIIQSKVEQLGDRVDAQGSAITQVTAKLGGTPNMLKDSSFARGFTYWTLPGGTSASILNEPRFGNYMNVNAVAGGAASQQRVDTGAGVYVLSGEVYRNSNAGTVRLEVAAYNANGYIGAVSAISDPSIVGQWQQVYITIAAPAGTTYLVCRPIWENTNVNNSIRRMKLELGSTPTLWTDDTAVQLAATATQILETRATQLENGQTRLEAKAGVLLDVNGRVIGWRANNDGAQGIFDIVADRLNVTDPNGTGSTTFEAGRWVTRSGGYMQVHGKPFGVTGDLMMYIGVGSDPNAASKANGIFWIDNKGNAYFGGSLSAGVLRNAVQTSTTQTVGTELLNGPFRTNGGNRTVTLSFSRTHSRRRSASGPTGFVAGAGSNTAQVQLFRQIGTGAWALWQVLNVTGSVDIRNEPDEPDFAISGWGGSFTVNDSSSPLENVAYRAVVTAFTEQAVSHQAGSFDSQSITQNLSIISVEQ